MGWQSLSLISPTPHSTKQKEKPPPPGAAPHPNLGCTFSGFQQSYGSGGQGIGEVAHQSWLKSGSDLGLLAHPGTHKFVPFVFLKDSTQPYQGHRPIRNISPQIRN